MTLWGLLDDRPGHASQVRGLCAALGPYRPVPLSYNTLARLPNALLPGDLSHLTAEARAQLTPPWPDLVIACGRRTHPVARWIRAQHPATKLVCLMRPDHEEGWDTVVLPEHDAPQSAPHIIATLGPLHGLDAQALDAARVRWQGEFAALARPLVGVLAGGAPKGGRMAEDFLPRMLAAARALAGEGTLLITSSRRTPEGFLAQAAQGAGAHWLYDWRRGGENPLAGIIALADGLVVTGDSLSMCVEATASAKPVFIAADGLELPAKHRTLHESLYDKGLARPLTADASLDWCPAAPLNEAHRVAQELRKRVGW